MDTEALVSHLPLVLAPLDLTVVLHRLSEHVQRLASLLVHVLFSGRIPLEVDPCLVVTISVMVLKGVDLLLLEAEVLGIFPGGSLAEKTAVSLLELNRRDLLQGGLQVEVDHGQVDAVLLEAHQPSRPLASV